ncbi:MAG: DNA-directed RNA polymerase subunit alpha [Patescibacteria group bacterium]|nr:DNA-directed RNA polymerase subunit alpha [Patescibacteria group bacterium]MDD4610536.1 DNA-directed RNA polymerase subunit alpha [Patescibacteria group bacterium]
MNDIVLPKKIEFKAGESANQGIVTVEPCYPGYGTTLGNSLRRVLLSSLPGAAVVSVKIKGVDHEFMSLPHVKEDVLDIILNLKQLRLKIFSESDEEIKLELNAHGAKEVKAGDITKNSEVEIVNPDLILAHITDMAGSLNMEIYVSRGRGYRSIESIEEKKHEIGHIDMDSIFSPVVSVGISVDSMRVGKMTNWDKLILDIVTDGTITPQKAFEDSAQILINQFNALLGEEVEKKAQNIEEEKVEEESIEEDAESVSEELTTEKKRRGRPKKS